MKNSLSRDQFLEYAWKWTNEYGYVILDQLKKIGCSCDWDRTKFTLDPMMSKALICSQTYNCSVEVLTIVSMLSVGSAIFYRPKDKALHADVAKRNFARGGGGDHLTLLRCYNEWMKTNYSQQ